MTDTRDTHQVYFSRWVALLIFSVLTIYADLFDYTLIDDEKEIVKVGTNAHYWLDKLPQVVTKDNDEYLSLNYGVLGTVCALSVSKYVK